MHSDWMDTVTCILIGWGDVNFIDHDKVTCVSQHQLQKFYSFKNEQFSLKFVLQFDFLTLFL